MKLETALRYARDVASRVHGVNGLLATPLCEHEAVRISRIWVFGSTVKGSPNPNDLDLLIELKECGRFRTRRQARLDKRYFRNYGIRLALPSRDEALKWLTKGMRKVSRHCVDTERVEIDVKVMIYPRMDLFCNVQSGDKITGEQSEPDDAE